MISPQPFVDIHCHLLPEIDDGAGSWDEALGMARMAVEDGIATIVATPHQLGSFRHNTGAAIRELAARFQQRLDEEQIPLRVWPGADVRIEPDMTALLRRGEVLSLADRRRHVLLELPHELYFPLEPVLEELRAGEMQGILSHPERNLGLQTQWETIVRLVDAGCLMQITAGSLLGTFGPAAQELSRRMLEAGLVHFVSTNAHGLRSRRPRLSPAFERVAELTDPQTAIELCCTNPAAVAAGEKVTAGRRNAVRKRLTGWFSRKVAG